MDEERENEPPGDEIEAEEPKPATPNQRKRKAATSAKITPANKALKLSTPKAPKKGGSENNEKEKDDINAIKIDTVLDLDQYRQAGNEDELPWSNPALVKYFFVENKQPEATTVEIQEWIKKLGSYKLKTKTQIQNAVKHPLCGNTGNFAWVSRGRYRCTLFGQAKAEEPVDRVETREFEEAEHEVTWISQTNFTLEEHEFNVKNKKSGRYGKCVKCEHLRHRLANNDWKVNGEPYAKRKVASLKFRSKNVVFGCPWKIDNEDHLCLLFKTLDRQLRIDETAKRMKEGEERILNLINEIEEQYADASDGFNIDEIEKELKEFIIEMEDIHEYVDGQKPHFLYFLVKDGVISYGGISADFEKRLSVHPFADQCSSLFEDEKSNVEMIVAPLGKRSSSFIKDCEATVIQLGKAGVLEGDISLVNKDDGKFQSKDEILKDIIEDEDHPKRADLIAAFKQLLQLSLKEGIRVNVTGTATSDKASKTKKLVKKNNIKLERLQVPKIPASTNSTQSSQGSIHQSSQSLVPPQLEELKSFIDAQSLLHPYNLSQKPHFFYILKDPESSKVWRYGITDDPKRRKEQLGKNLGYKFEMITAPLGNQREEFVKDIEAACIRLSRKKLLKDGKENKNKEKDVGIFASTYSVLEETVEIECMKRRDLIKAMNQLVDWTVKYGSKILDYVDARKSLIQPDMQEEGIKQDKLKRILRYNVSPFFSSAPQNEAAVET